MVHAATLTDIRLSAPHTKQFRLQVEGEERFEFQPGQHILVHAEPPGSRAAHPYSIASPPRPDNVLELCLNRVENSSSFSRYLFDLEKGARIKFDGPHGGFQLCSNLRDSLFVATGTGIAPIRSMVHHLLRPAGGQTGPSGPGVAGEPRDLTLLFGVRYEDSILYRDEFDELARWHPDFHFVPTLSRPTEHWSGATGYVQEHVIRLLHGRSDVDVYICGLKGMVDEVREELLSIGYDPSAIFHEKYD